MNQLPLPMPDKAGLKRFWSRARILAAQLIAEADLTHEQIAAKVGKSQQWLYESKRLPWFKQRVAELAQELADDARLYGLSNQRKRLAEQDERWQAMISVRKERARELGPRYDGVPGVHTGLVIPVAKMVKVYEVNGTPAEDDDTKALTFAGERMVYEWEVDTGLLTAQLQLERQAARELGQEAARAAGMSFGDNARVVVITRNVPELGM